MPPAIKYLSPNSSERSAFINASVNERTERAKAYDLAANYYDGKQKKFLDIKEGEPDDNLVVNMFQSVVDRTVGFLFPSVPKFKTDNSTTQENDDERWIRECLDFSGGLALMHDTGMNGALSGHCFLKLYPKLPNDPFPTIFPLDPRTVTVYWDYRDLRKIVWIEIYWSATLGSAFMFQPATEFQEFLQDIVYQEGGTWKIFDYSRVATATPSPMIEGGWTLEAQDTWNYPFCPVVHWKHGVNANEFYGRSEATHLGLGDRVNLIWSEVARIIRYYASPRTVAIGLNSEEIQKTSIDGLYTVPEGSDVKNLEMTGDLGASQKAAEYFHDQYLAQSRVVILKGNVKDFQRVTDASVRTLFLDMLLKVNILKQHYGYGLQEAVRRLMIIGGRGDTRPVIVWPDPLPTDATAAVVNSQIERQMNVVSRETVSEKLGHNWNDELGKMKAEADIPVFNPVQTQPTPTAIDKSES